MLGVDFVMCFENWVLFCLEFCDVIWWVENFWVLVGLGLLLGCFGLFWFYEIVDWGLRLLWGNFCGFGNGFD